MGTWNTGPFDNDDAAELLDDIREGHIYFDELLPDVGHRYIAADQGAMIVAMAHLAAGSVPEGIDDSQLESLRTPQNRERLRQCLEAVISDGTVSELAGQWAESGQDKLLEWKAQSHVQLI
ncbi:DUF4259 domain-containing protein [Corynebacterium nasicanis]|uniref:DUF4259 domain-containing protein n=1 Tax=Corynebacterium nasicanis TaxID=1448267 RepID=A0ABW1QB34_9CORY